MHDPSGLLRAVCGRFRRRADPGGFWGCEAFFGSGLALATAAGPLGFGGLGLQLKDFFSGGSGGGVWLRSGEFFERIDFGALEEALRGLLGRRSRPGAATLATGLRLVWTVGF